MGSSTVFYEREANITYLSLHLYLKVVIVALHHPMIHCTFHTHLACATHAFMFTDFH